jgi:septal ring factor EnvC (AmiA/AmiB activator)
VLQWLPLIIAAGTAFWTMAIQSKQVEQNSADIAKLEARYDQTQVIMQSVDSRLARIETTLDIVTGGKQPGGSYARPR